MYSFEIESQNLTNNLICKHENQGKKYKLKGVEKMKTKNYSFEISCKMPYI